MILVIDDNDIIRSWVVRMLRADGFVVLEAARASHGIGLLAAFDVALVIQDFVLPYGGEELFTELKKTRNVPIIVLTGLSAELVNYVPFDAVLEKPCGSQEVIAAVRRFVDPPGRPRGGGA